MSSLLAWVGYVLVVATVVPLANRWIGARTLRRARGGAAVLIGAALLRDQKVLWGSLLPDGTDWLWIPRVPLVRARRWRADQVDRRGVPVDQIGLDRCLEYGLATGDRLAINVRQAQTLTLLRSPGPAASGAARVLAAQSRLVWWCWAAALSVTALLAVNGVVTLGSAWRFGLIVTGAAIVFGGLTWLTGLRVLDQRQARAAPPAALEPGPWQAWQRRAVERAGSGAPSPPRRITRWSPLGDGATIAFQRSPFLAPLALVLSLGAVTLLTASGWEAHGFAQGPVHRVPVVVTEDSRWLPLTVVQQTEVRLPGDGSSLTLQSIRRFRAGQRAVVDQAGHQVRLPGAHAELALLGEGALALLGAAGLVPLVLRRGRAILRQYYSLPHSSRPYAAFRWHDGHTLVVLLADDGHPELTFPVFERIPPAGTIEVIRDRAEADWLAPILRGQRLRQWSKTSARTAEEAQKLLAELDETPRSEPDDSAQRAPS